MYDLHTHSYYSDGVLGLSELVRRCQVQGYKGIVISDHCDLANVESVVGRVRRYCDQSQEVWEDITVLPGCELTHVPPQRMSRLVELARNAGARVVLVHGETPVEPVAEGTNRAGIDAGADVVAHPGLIREDDARVAAQNGVMLEISGRKGHSYTNGHVVQTAQSTGAPLSFGSDGHAPGDYPTLDKAHLLLRGAGLSDTEAKEVMQRNKDIFFDRDEERD